MANKRVLIPCLALAVLCAACSPKHTDISAEETSSAPPPPAPQTSSASLMPEQSEISEPLVWTTDPVLADDEVPADYHGLELPVNGATGYATITLPVWAHSQDSEAARQAVEQWEKLQEEKAKAEAEAKAKAEAEAKAKAEAEAQAQAEADKTTETEDGQEAQETHADSSAVHAVDSGSGNTSAPVSGDGSLGDATLSGAADGSTAGSAQLSVSSPPPQPEPAPEPAPASQPQAQPEAEPEPPTLTDGSLGLIPPGTAFTILTEDGDWWKVTAQTSYVTSDGVKKQGTLTGWVEHRYCMINLPDVIPSIVYDATNAYSSRFVSCGQELEGVTGTALYQGNKAFNPRLDQDEFLMPVLYSMSKRLAAAQRLALSEGNTLVLYEGFRPYSAQMQVVNAVRALLKERPELKDRVSEKPWDISWFIATGVANHQQGYAVDVSVARVHSVVVQETGQYRYTRVEEYECYETPSPIHELSTASVTFVAPVSSFSLTAWESAQPSPAMNDAAFGLQRYCTQAGLTPLASEWWHFNDLHSYFAVQDNLGQGNFVIDCCRSAAPT